MKKKYVLWVCGWLIYLFLSPLIVWGVQPFKPKSLSEYDLDV